MAVSKAQQASVNKYVKANYDRINVTMPKGEKEVIQECAAAQGESVNGFIVRAVRERIERDAGGPQEITGVAQGERTVSLPSETIEAAQEAAQTAGENLPQFVARAIQTQIEEDIGDRKASEDVAAMLRETIQSGMVQGENLTLLEDTLKSIEAKGVPHTT